MADLSVTAANCLKNSNAVTEDGTFGATITAGQAVYRDASTGKYLLADADSATVAARTPRGIALNSGSDGQPAQIQRSGDITLGATMTAGVTYYLSNTAGGICPVADVGTGEFFCIIGIASSTTVLKLAITASGVSA